MIYSIVDVGLIFETGFAGVEDANDDTNDTITDEILLKGEDLKYKRKQEINEIICLL